MKRRRIGVTGESVGAILISGILLLMILPLPTWVLDLCLGISITGSLTLLFVSLYLKRPLDLSTFPSILLLVTLFRLSLNIASTRLILLHGQEGASAAGNIIASFGSFVVGGNYAVGIIVFLILVVINFVVITKGAGRIAEVAARFTLDAMPGKQMSIDADLNAGLLDEREARRKRQEIQLESDFYGAMDGASKFVRGDAIAGLLITAINLLGGLLIGVFYYDLPAGEAASTYTILTIGDGLVSQIPALVVSTAAGVLITRAGGQRDLTNMIGEQLGKHRRALVLVGVVLGGFALLPGMPAWLFLSLAAVTVVLGLRRGKADQGQEDGSADTGEASQMTEIERIEAALPVDLLGLELGYGLIPLVDRKRGGSLLNRIASIREQTATRLGFVLPPVRIRDNLQLPPGTYVVLLRGTAVARAEVVPDRYLALHPADDAPALPGIPTREPTFGLPALWIEEGNRERAEALGYTVVDQSSVIATHLTDVIHRHADELLGRQEMQQLLDVAGRTCPRVIEELLPNTMTHAELLKLLRALLGEGVSIRDLRTIMETLADHAAKVKDTDALADLVRERLGRAITAQFLDPDGVLHAMFLEPEVEEQLRGSLELIDGQLALTVDPEVAHLLITNIQAQLREASAQDTTPVLLVSAELRRPLVSVCRRFLPELAVLSHREVDPAVEVRSMATVGA